MKVEFTHIKTKFDTMVKIFEQNNSDPTLKDHALSGKLKGYRSFFVTGDIRVIYYIHENIAYFVDIGTHNQVY